MLVRRDPGCMPHGGERAFPLQQHGVSRTDDGGAGIDVMWLQGSIRAWVDDDAVLAGVVHDDEVAPVGMAAFTIAPVSTPALRK